MIWRALYLAAPPFPTKLSVYIESHRLCCYIAAKFPAAQRIYSAAPEVEQIAKCHNKAKRKRIHESLAVGADTP